MFGITKITVRDEILFQNVNLHVLSYTVCHDKGDFNIKLRNYAV